jgi:hypothetical protein
MLSMIVDAKENNASTQLTESALIIMTTFDKEQIEVILKRKKDKKISLIY